MPLVLRQFFIPIHNTQRSVFCGEDSTSNRHDFRRPTTRFTPFTDATHLHSCAAYTCWLLILGTVLMTMMTMIIITSPPLSHSGSATHRHPSRQRMDSPIVCATIRAMSIAGKSNHSATGRLHPHCSATCLLRYTALPPPPKKSNLTLPIGAIHPTGKNHPPANPAHHTIQHNW